MMSNLVQCKACNKEVAKGVKKCPHCGKDQRNWFMRHKIMTFIVAIILIAIISSAAGGGGSDSASTSGSTPADSSSKVKEEKVYKVNEPVVVDEKAEIVITKVEEKAQVGNEFISKKASDGGTLVAVQLTVKNVSEKPIGAFSTPTFKLVDEKGTEYETDIDASSNYSVETNIDNSKLMSDLNPNIKVTDVQVYEISKESYASGKWFIQVSGKEKIQIK
ncbi:DUF4352 domain-containing protein [Peribacillus saganii]|uniref:DUF4352 domain-containing protein n=1 Tax=Peribacillus saganii TaxID=2303992 RepID=A0A372LPG8_9BACI|nr:DUF4352 domain-containing protein [Peribacillus saganii]RFU69870.1 DUF4352 domain-containing protein [Peribacillus saganii]